MMDRNEIIKADMKSAREFAKSCAMTMLCVLETDEEREKFIDEIMETFMDSLNEFLEKSPKEILFTLFESVLDDVFGEANEVK